MQTYAEKGLIEAIAIELKKKPGSRILNIGSSGSIVIETELEQAGADFIVDHLDIDPREANFSKLDKTYTESAENMKSVPSERYDISFSNFVWEHIPDVNRALKEANRITKNGGDFIFSVPNPLAPEFLLVRIIPLWMRGKFKKYEVWPTYYNYKTITSLKQRCLDAGFSDVKISMYPAVYTYTYRYPILSLLGKAYDTLLDMMGLNSMMGHAVLVCKK